MNNIICTLLSSPLTGDTSKPWLWAVIAGAAVVLAVVVIILGKNNKNDDGE